MLASCWNACLYPKVSLALICRSEVHFQGFYLRAAPCLKLCLDLGFDLPAQVWYSTTKLLQSWQYDWALRIPTQQLDIARESVVFPTSYWVWRGSVQGRQDLTLPVSPTRLYVQTVHETSHGHTQTHIQSGPTVCLCIQQ